MPSKVSYESLIRKLGALGALAWKSALSWGDVSGKPDFANVAVSGSYDDLADAPEVYTQDETYT
ncbi:MAG: hypothetical protein LBJ72_03755, partial [Dysgonamonadaceae bacterium]|nr:hypothetical protein [Dysgonamonadaceae bacterium]